MTKGHVLQIVAIVLSLAAALISFNLLAKHLSKAPGPAWFEAGCSGNEEGGADCAAVLASPYASFPFGAADATTGARRVPVAFLGLAYYSALVAWLIAVGRPAYTRRWVHFLPLGFVGAGLAGSAFFTFIMFTKLDEWCPWCMATHVLNLLIAISLVLMWPRRPAIAAGAEASETGSALPEEQATACAVAAGDSSPEAYPSTRLVLVTLSAIALLWFGQIEMLGKARVFMHGVASAKNFRACMAAISSIKGDADRLFADWEQGVEYEIPIRPDDAMRPAAPPDRPVMQVVVFSDFQCPSCRLVADFLGEKPGALFGGALQIVFKHYPLHRACNPQTKTRVHKRACRGARMAEAARIVGGNEAFWRAHDYIYANQEALKDGSLGPEKLAADLGLDTDAYLAATSAEEITARIAEDTAVAAGCGVTATPGVFAQGKRVNRLAVGEMGFWDKLADYYWKSIDTPRPASTELPVVEATLNNPGP